MKPERIQNTLIAKVRKSTPVAKVIGWAKMLGNAIKKLFAENAGN